MRLDQSNRLRCFVVSSDWKCATSSTASQLVRPEQTQRTKVQYMKTLCRLLQKWKEVKFGDFTLTWTESGRCFFSWLVVELCKRKQSWSSRVPRHRTRSSTVKSSKNLASTAIASSSLSCGLGRSSNIEVSSSDDHDHKFHSIFEYRQHRQVGIAYAGRWQNLDESVERENGIRLIVERRSCCVEEFLFSARVS